MSVPFKFAVPSDGGTRCMLLLVGEPYTGKSTSATTFPDPLFIDLDHKVPATRLVNGVKVPVDTLPFWNAEFCDKFKRRANKNDPPNKRDAVLNFLEKHITEVSPTCTLVLDSLTMLSAAFHHQTEEVETLPINPRTNKTDGFYLWKEKINYFNAVMELLKVHPGHVVVIAHEQKKRDESGDLTEVIKPVMTGAFCDLIMAHFTLVFRQTMKKKGTVEEYWWDVKPTPFFRSNNTLGMTVSPVKAEFASLKPFLDNPQPIEVKFDIAPTAEPKGDVALT